MYKEGARGTDRIVCDTKKTAKKAREKDVEDACRDTTREKKGKGIKREEKRTRKKARERECTKATAATRTGS